MMTVEYVETEAPTGDLRGRILDEMNDRQPWVLITTAMDGDGFSTTLEVGGGIDDVETVRRLLRKVLDGIPGGAE